jgi:putative ABC transport system permease protein
MIRNTALIFSHAVRMTRRDWRAGELRFLLLALVIAVAASSAVGFFVDRMNRALSRDAAQLLGADLLVRSDYPLNQAWRTEAQRLSLSLADTVTFPSMASTGDGEQVDTRLVAVKAVSSDYPLRGNLQLERAGTTDAARGAPKRGEVWVDASFLASRQITQGATLKLGEGSFRISATILLEQDRGAGFMSFAPRVMIALEDLEATGLLQPGSRITYRLQVAGDPDKVRSYRLWLEDQITATDTRGVQLEALDAGRPEMRATLDRARQFLALVSLLTAMLAALAIALAARRFMQRHLDGVAMLRCLGLQQNEVTQIYLIEFLLIGLAGGVIGAMAGFGAHFLLLQWLGALMQVTLPAPDWLPLLQGVLTGLLLLLGFALPPVLQLRNVPHNRVIRREQPVPQPFTLAGYLIALVCFVTLLLWQTGELKLGLWTAAGFAAALVLFAGFAWALLRVLRWSRTSLDTPAWRFALDSLRRRPAASVLQIVSLALGLMALLLLTVTRHDLLAAWQQSAPPDAPNHFIINIQPEQRAPIEEILHANGMSDIQLYPMIRGRLIQRNDTVIGPQSFTEERAQRLIEREFNLSTMPSLPPANTIVQGRWFDASAQRESSVEQGIAKTLGLKLGDRLRFDVAGVPVETTITSIRKLDWGSMRVNFFVILDPVAGAALPSTSITAFYLPPSKQALVNQLVRDYPNLTIVDVGSMVVQVQQVISQVVSAVEFLFLFTLAAGVMVLAAAMLVSQHERAHESALLRALGATRAQLSNAQWVECVLVGGSAGLLAAIGATAVGWVLAYQVLDVEWIFRPTVLLAGLGLGVASALAGGWFGLHRVLSRPPILTLREG